MTFKLLDWWPKSMQKGRKEERISASGEAKSHQSIPNRGESPTCLTDFCQSAFNVCHPYSIPPLLKTLEDDERNPPCRQQRQGPQ
jgi:hypothetical protein